MKKLKNIFKILSVFAVLTTWSGISTGAPIVYVHDGSGNLGTVDVATGDVDIIGSLGVVLTDIAFDPNGNLFGLSFNRFFTVDLATGAATDIGGHGILGGNALVFGTDGTLYGAGNSTTSLFQLDPNTGATTSLGDTGFTSAGDLAFNGGDLFLAAGSNELVRLDLNNLSNSSSVGSFSVSGVNDVFGLASSDQNDLYAVANTTLYTVDTSNAALSNPVSFAGGGLGVAFGESFFTEAGAVDPVPVSEPSTFALLAIGVFGVTLTRRRVTRLLASRSKI